MAKTLSLSDRQKQIYLKYSGRALPRYASYPGISQWKDTSTITTVKEHLDATAHDQKAFSLYFHVPFCQKLCFYSGSQKGITSPASHVTQDQVQNYLQGLEREVMHLAHHVDNCIFEQLHIGGGTPNFMTLDQWKQFHENILSRFTISEEAEWSVDLDPRLVTPEQVRYLHDIGVNRVSLGILDFDGKRNPSFEQVAQAVEMIRGSGIAFINFDMIYGLPQQTAETMREMLDKVVRLGPDRIAYSSFESPDTKAETTLALHLLGINRFLEAGYDFIGLDHFAKPNEPLAVASRKDQVQRNFQGMTAGATLPLLGFGPGAISMLYDMYVQNPKTDHDWRAMVENHEYERKARMLREDDKIRREVINQVFCHGTIDKPYTEAFHDVEFDHYFARELQGLKTLAQDGLLTLDSHDIRLSQPLGLLLRRVVAAAFDASKLG